MRSLLPVRAKSRSTTRDRLMPTRPRERAERQHISNTRTLSSACDQVTTRQAYQNGVPPQPPPRVDSEAPVTACPAPPARPPHPRRRSD